ncbi:allergen Tha p 1-like [Pieris rapae]|uniref:allergen Tha p 1-like n=1 Tax=Pieris rapae TaxID=64459 RepID=UPI001E27BB79|nr:allergen Tha p 1-like [Pieris rapae]
MKLALVLVLSCLALAWAKPSTYTDKYDNVNVDEVLESDRLLKGYVECLMERSRCPPDAKTLKETLPDALENECKKCTAKQKTNADKVVRHLVNKRPELWKELASKYDPKDQYQQRYKDKIDAVKET